MSKQEFICESCGEPCEDIQGCYRCGKLVGDCCVAAFPEGEEPDEPVCEGCF